MGRIIQQKGEKGSLRWIQYILNNHPHMLDNSINKFLPDSHSQPIEWLSPLSDDDYAEYKDQTFLDLLGIKLTKKELWGTSPIKDSRSPAKGGFTLRSNKDSRPALSRPGDYLKYRLSFMIIII